jgi:hypothetical protein
MFPSDTAAPGGKEVAQKVSHYIEAGGRFERACAELVKQGFDPLYVELWSEAGEKTRKTTAAQPHSNNAVVYYLFFASQKPVAKKTIDDIFKKHRASVTS